MSRSLRLGRVTRLESTPPSRSQPIQFEEDAVVLGTGVISMEEFDDDLQDALAHLYDFAYLQAHPLAKLLVPDVATESPGRALHRIIRQAIDGLKPPAEVRDQSPAGRAYHCLVLRYQEGLTMGQVADELGISPRQCRRAHHEALEAIRTTLWPRPASDGNAADPARASTLSLLAEEATRLNQGATAGATDFAEALGGVMVIIEPLAKRFDVRLAVISPVDPISLAVNRATFRQILLALFHLVIEAVPGGIVSLTTTQQPNTVVGTITGLPGSATPGGCLFASARLAIGRQLLEAAGGWLRHADRSTESILEFGLPTARSLNVLVVDDNPDALRLISRYLGGSGYRVLTARDGPEALAVAETTRLDVITMDVMMPNQDGWEVLQTLLSHPITGTTPVIICSVLPERDLALMLGAADFLQKPFGQSELLAALARITPVRSRSPDSP